MMLTLSSLWIHVSLLSLVAICGDSRRATHGNGTSTTNLITSDNRIPERAAATNDTHLPGLNLNGHLSRSNIATSADVTIPGSKSVLLLQTEDGETGDSNGKDEATNLSLTRRMTDGKSRKEPELPRKDSVIRMQTRDRGNSDRNVKDEPADISLSRDMTNPGTDNELDVHTTHNGVKGIQFSDDSFRSDFFNCSQTDHCLCRYAPFGGDVAASCINQFLESVPGDLPWKITTLNVSRNRILDVDFSQLFKYTYLNKVYFRSSGIKTISKIMENDGSLSLLHVLDLSFNNITSISGSVFAVFSDLKELYLQGNSIRTVDDDSFEGIPHLHILDLSFNQISVIDPTTFHSLSKLEHLFLYSNEPLGYSEEKMSPDLFKPLSHLKSLHIQGSSNGSFEYPNKALGEILSLRELNIDALGPAVEFGEQFGKLALLETLRFGPYADCRLTRMSPSFFQYFPRLKSLSFHSCNITINPKAYRTLHELESLALDSVPSLTLDDAFRNLTGFHKTSLKHISFINLINWDWPCIWLTKDQGKYMSHLNLTSIDLSNNRLSLLSDSFLSAIPLTLERLILRDNKFTLIKPFWHTLTNLTNLTFLDVSYQNMEIHDYHILTHRKYGPAPYKFFPLDDTKQVRNDRQSCNSHDTRQDVAQRTADISEVVQIPASLKTVRAGWYNYFGGVLINNNAGVNNLEELNFSRSSLSDWGQGSVPRSVKRLDVTRNGCFFIGKNFFPVNNSLTHLNLQYNFLGDYLAGTDGSLLKDLDNLLYLGLSTNEVYHLPYHFFRGLRKVEIIDLSHNRLEILNVSFEHTPNLQYLDLRENSVSKITESTRRDLDKLASKRSGMVIDLHYNSLQCTCEKIDMLHWMATTKVYFRNLPLYQCTDGNDEPIDINSKKTIQNSVDYLHRKCLSKGYLLFGCLSMGLIFLLFIITGISYKFRWWIRYKKHVFKAKWFGFKPNARTSACYRYDAFLIYSEQDRSFAIDCHNELEKERGHKLCVSDRDILPGTDELAAIVNVIQNSRMTLVVITDSFLQDMATSFRECPMVHYALQMAVMEELCTARKTMHVILRTQYEDAKYPPYLLKVLRDGCVTQFPVEGDDVTGEMSHVSWHNLSTAIGHAHRVWEGGDDHALCFPPYTDEAEDT